MSGFDKDAARARADAATRGPWHWSGNTDTRTVRLSTWMPGQGCYTIMDFDRWGMQGAAPRFNDDGLMYRVDEVGVVYEVAPNAASRKDPSVYRADIVGIRHPDAEFIAHARTDLPAALDALDEAEATIARVCEKRIVCPVHNIPDCSPLLNGCSIPNYIDGWRLAALDGPTS